MKNDTNELIYNIETENELNGYGGQGLESPVQTRGEPASATES